eukprot:CAMPEP_0171280450 /NCGR_PEP_ID=MMETSP0790-20130122/65901_1 /TAXON_ID=2925 /ORGANISM="Alexandrium catenella, Strain OF101" /LENGTH=30 /DNA_ID= /DNA_START= /DNA_END= /DNA_ORIENTATION=
MCEPEACGSAAGMPHQGHGCAQGACAPPHG